MRLTQLWYIVDKEEEEGRGEEMGEEEEEGESQREGVGCTVV